MRQDISTLLDEIAYDYSFVCVDYLSEVGKIGAQNNAETLRWAARSSSVRKLRKKVQLLETLCLTSSLEERYWVLRELYMIKPGAHEHFFPEGHYGRVLQYLQEWFINPTASMKSRASYHLKSILAIENLYNLEPFFSPNISAEYVSPTTVHEAQRLTKMLMEQTNYEAVMKMTALRGWFNYAPCAVNEGPFVFRLGTELATLGRCDLVCEHTIPYEEILNG